jgi:hypothetical protein
VRRSRLAYAVLAAGLVLAVPACAPGSAPVDVADAAAPNDAPEPPLTSAPKPTASKRTASKPTAPKPVAPKIRTSSIRDAGCAGQVGVLFSDGAAPSDVPPTNRMAKAAVRERIADPKHSLNGERLRLTAEPHPYNERYVVVHAHATNGTSDFTVTRSKSGSARITQESLCYPPRKASVGPTSTRLPQPVPD